MPPQELMTDVKNFFTYLYTRKEDGYDIGFPKTYTARNFHERSKQCSSGRARSFGDLLKIANTYFEGTTPQELMRVIVSLIDTKDEGIMLIYCPNINKIVLHTNEWERLINNKESNKTLIPYLFNDYSNWISRNAEIIYEDEFDFFTVMSYIGITREMCLPRLKELQKRYTFKEEHWPEDEEGIEQYRPQDWK